MNCNQEANFGLNFNVHLHKSQLQSISGFTLFILSALFYCFLVQESQVHVQLMFLKFF